MKVAIVGGSGMLGRHIAAGLVARGDEVTILTRRPESVRSISSAIAVRPWTVADPAGLARTLRGIDAVINLAGVPVGPTPWTPGRRRAIRASRLDTTRAIVVALEILPTDHRPRVLVNASGTDTYTGLDATAATESTPPSDGWLAGICREWEGEAMRARSSDVRVVALRIGFVLASDAASLGIYALPFRLGLGGPLGDGRQWMSWIHVDDLVALVRFVLDEPRAAGIVNAVGPAPARQADVAAAIGAALGRCSWLRVPAWLLRLAMRSQAILPLGSRRIAPARAVELGFRFAWVDLRAAMADVLAIRPRGA
jgi:uncharacterized protein (TIGR01777 family)